MYIPCNTVDVCSSGGLSNLLYQCSLPEKLKPQDDEPAKVMLRIYGQIIRENPDTVVTDSVIFSALAEKNMGPKLYGVFTGGRVEEYLDVSTVKPALKTTCI